MSKHENFEDDVEVTDDDLKKAMDVKQNEELGDAPDDSSTEEKSTPVTSPEDVKSVTGVKKVSEAVPYERFKEVLDKQTRLELELEQEKQRKVETKVTEPDPDELTEEDKLYFDEAQLRVIEKIAARREKQAINRINTERQYWEEAHSNFKKASTKFPELANRESEIFKRADKIVRDKYTQWSSDRKTYYIPPNAQWLAALEANEEIREEKERLQKATKEEDSNKKQNGFVSTKTKRAPVASKATQEDEDNMSPAEMDRAMKEDFEKRQEALDN